jgi:signal transduction histidine kinase
VADRGASPNGTDTEEGGDAHGALIVDGDAARLEQAILNLLNNAITHAPESPRIDVRLCRVDGAVKSKASAKAPAPHADMAEINVQDYGKGIAAKDQSGLFTRFYQVNRSNAQPTQGLGLGLYITRQIVEAHGGTISVESTEGEGTTFTIRLPLLEESADLTK